MISVLTSLSTAIAELLPYLGSLGNLGDRFHYSKKRELKPPPTTNQQQLTETDPREAAQPDAPPPPTTQRPEPTPANADQ